MMHRSLKFCGFLVVNLSVAVIATAILDTGLRRMIPAHTVASIVWTEIILSIVCAGFIGFFIRRTWRSSAAKWIWVPAVLWFLFGYLTVAGEGNVWGRLSGFGSGGVLSAPDMRTFFAFTVPLIRAIAYSAGAHVSALLYGAQSQLAG